MALSSSQTFTAPHSTLSVGNLLELPKENYNVVIIDDLSNSYFTVLDRICTLASEYFASQKRFMPSLRFHEVDYRSPVIRSILNGYALPPFWTLDTQVPRSRIMGVIHFAAFKSVDESIRHPLRYYSNNVGGLIEFTSILETFGIKTLVFSSSATIYGASANHGIPLKEEDCIHHHGTAIDERGEERTLQPNIAEAVLADIARADPAWSIAALRYFNPIGCHESGLLGDNPRQKPSNLIPAIANVLTGKSPAFQIFGTDWDTGDGTAVRDFIHVTDLARGHISAFAVVSQAGIQGSFRAFNLGSGRGHSVLEVLASLEKVSAQGIPTKLGGRRKGNVGFCVAEVSRARRELRWRTEKTLDDCALDIWNFLMVERQRDG
ncbi:hypothetical protein B0O99DRAFT_733826 [Bisporella sp. PMI_857]|nr:hypothetical protein B0O99DRAFT_733826 [Bisporella sp. PMI_857]